MRNVVPVLAVAAVLGGVWQWLHGMAAPQLKGAVVFGGYVVAVVIAIIAKETFGRRPGLEVAAGNAPDPTQAARKEQPAIKELHRPSQQSDVARPQTDFFGSPHVRLPEYRPAEGTLFGISPKPYDVDVSWPPKTRFYGGAVSPTDICLNTGEPVVQKYLIEAKPAPDAMWECNPGRIPGRIGGASWGGAQERGGSYDESLRNYARDLSGHSVGGELLHGGEEFGESRVFNWAYTKDARAFDLSEERDSIDRMWKKLAD